MNISKRFPIQGYAEVKIEGEVLKVKYRYPTRAQVQAMGDESNTHGYAMSICKYCIEDIEGLTENGVALGVQKDKDGTLSDDFVVMLYNNGLAFKLASFYTENVSPTALEKKRYSTLPDASKKESESPSLPEKSDTSVTG